MAFSLRPGPERRSVLRIAAPALAAAVLLGGCGGDDDADAERLVNERIKQERAEAARDARQEERIRELEEDAREARRRRSSGGPSAAAPATPSDGNAPAGGGDWPGGSAYTAILASLRSEGEARALQAEATQRGLDAGVLQSSDFRSLRPGYWVVFSGSFPSQSDAARRAARAKELGYGQSYPRLVSP